MKEKSKTSLLGLREYLILTVLLIAFFIGGFYFLAGGEFPNNTNKLYSWILVIVISVPISIYLLKKITD